MPEFLAPYASSILALTILTLMFFAQSFYAGLLKNGVKGQVSGMPAEGDYSDFTWRVNRTHQNMVENFSVIVASALLAMIAGASPTLVAWLVWIIVGLRMAFWVFYYGGVGKAGGGIRSICYVAGLVATGVLAIVALLAML